MFEDFMEISIIQMLFQLDFVIYDKYIRVNNIANIKYIHFK